MKINLQPKFYKRSPYAGFTLIEIMMAFVISSVFLLSIGFTFSNLVGTRQRILSATNVQKTSDQMLLNLTQEARWAKVVSVLSLTTIQFENDNSRIRYQLVSPGSGTSYIEKYSATLPEPVSNETTERITPEAYDVTEFSITNRGSSLDRPSFDISLTLESPQNNLIYTNHTAITPRNKFPGAT